MIALRRTESWSSHGRSSGLRRRFTRLSVPVLVVSAFLCGAGVAAAVFVGFWDTEAGRRQSAEASLAASRARIHTLAAETTRLRRRLTTATSSLARIERGLEQRRAATTTLLGENSALLDTTGGLHSRATSLERRASSVSSVTATLGADLVGLTDYLTKTDAASIDAAYVKAQLDYLRPAIERARTASSSLGTDARSYGEAVDRFARQAAAYAAALRRLQG